METNSKEVMRSEQLLIKIKALVKLLDDIDEMIQTQSSELQRVDLELSDWLHLIENNNLGESESFKVVENIHRLRVARRELNNEYALEQVFQTHKSRLTGNNTRQFLISEVEKTYKQLNQEYKNRILNEETVNETLNKEIKRKRGRPRKVKIGE